MLGSIMTRPKGFSFRFPLTLCEMDGRRLTVTAWAHKHRQTRAMLLRAEPNEAFTDVSRLLGLVA